MALRFNTLAWTGNAVDNRDIAGGSDFTTLWAFTRNQFASNGAMSWSAIGDDTSFRPGIAQDMTANYIQFTAGDPNTDGGMEVGSTNFVNQSTRAFVGATIGGDGSHYFASSYTGNGATQTITGVGFQGDLVIVKRSGGTTIGGYRIGSMPDTNSDGFGAVSFLTDGILRMNSDGFDLGANVTSNGDTFTYQYSVIKIPADQGEVGSYAGDDNDDRDISLSSGITPRWVWVAADTATTSPYFRVDTHAAGTCSSWTEATVNITDGIKSFGSGSFRIGTNAAINASGSNYYFLALTDAPVAASANVRNFLTLMGVS